VIAAIQGAHLAVVRSHFGHGAVAPAMADSSEFFAGGLEDVILFGGDIHLFRPKIFAEMWVHGVDWLKFTQ
jgi:hypothetical protein